MPGGTDGELWKTDGTPQGTVLVKDVYPGDDFMGPLNLLNVGGTLYFTAADSPTSGNAVWKSDGTEAGTVKVPVPGETAISATRSTALVDAVIFSGARPDNSRGLWRTDGTAAGTYLLRNLNAGGYSQDGFPRIVVGDELYFAADDGVHGRELWKTDGTVAGTTLVEDINPGPGSGGPTGGAALGDKLIFGARGLWNDAPGYFDDAEPWVSDGTEAGTFQLKDINPAPQSTLFGNGPFIPVGNSVLFEAGSFLHRSDGTSAGTERLLPLYLPQEGPNRGLGQAQLREGLVVFAASDHRLLQQLSLYASDGTAAGTMRLAAVAGLTPMPVVNGFAYFLGNDPASGVELWKTDGTPAGTLIVRNIAPGASGITQPTAANTGPGRRAIAAVGNVVYFRAFGDQLWRTDGTEFGTVMVKDFNLPSDGRLDAFASAGGKLFFESSSPGTTPVLWSSDGTDAGTRQVMQVDVISDIVPAEGRAFFLGTPPGTNWRVLFVSDGTPEGTAAVRDFGPTVSLAHPLTVFRGGVYLAMTDGLWESNGTAAGTVRLAEWPPAAPGTWARSLVVRHDALYFTVDDGIHGRELWKTDGTAAGTVLVTDINSGLAGSDPVPLAVVADGTLFFAATDPTHGRELWKLEPPMPRIWVRSRSWATSFKEYLAGQELGHAVYGYRVDDKPATDVLPWVNLDEIVIELPYAIGSDPLPFPGTPYPIDGDRPGSGQTLSADNLGPLTFVLRASRSLGSLSTGGENGVRFSLSLIWPDRSVIYRFNVLQGDADRSGSVVAQDFSEVKRRFFRSVVNPGIPGDIQYTVFHDLDGSGSILANDYAGVKGRFFDNFLPAATAAAAKRIDEVSAASNLFATTSVL